MRQISPYPDRTSLVNTCKIQAILTTKKTLVKLILDFNQPLVITYTNPFFSFSTEVVFKVVERADNGTTRTFNSNDIYIYLNQAHVKVSGKFLENISQK
jgi:hypothetical protein